MNKDAPRSQFMSLDLRALRLPYKPASLAAARAGTGALRSRKGNKTCRPRKPFPEMVSC
jgi:hypothetical protein